MKRYIRTKDGKIIPTKRLKKNDDNEFWVLNEFGIGTYIIDTTFIINQADTIEELIEVGDLYFYNIKLTDRKVENQFDILGLTYDKDIMLAKIRAGQIELTSLYTKQGNDYILVARKEKRKWRVL